MLMQSVGRMLHWPEARATCVMCGAAVEDAEHFVSECWSRAAGAFARRLSLPYCLPVRALATRGWLWQTTQQSL